MISYAFHAHVLAYSPPEYVGVCLAPLKTICYVKESDEDESNVDDEILILLRKLKQMANVEKKLKINFKGFLSIASCCASLARIFHKFFNVGKENILECLLEMDIKYAISFSGGFSFVDQKISAGKEIGMIVVKTEGEEKPSPYVRDIKNAIIEGDVEKLGLLCEKGMNDVPHKLQKLWEMVHNLREKGIPCYLSFGIFPLIITYPEIMGEIINALQIKNFDVEIVNPATQKDV